MTGRGSRTAGVSVLAAIGVLAIGAPFLSPNSPEQQFIDRAYAPPTPVRIRNSAGMQSPFVYRQVLEDRIMRRFRDESSAPAPVMWMRGGRLLSIDASQGPLLLLGADDLGRDVFSRLVYGARLSLGVTALGAFGALALGALIGGLAGTAGGRVDRWLMTLADFVLVLPAVYLILMLRAVLPLVLSTADVFWIMAVIFSLAGWPHVARGVRAIVASERTRDYAEAARASGAGPFRLLRHLLPAARGFLGVEVVLLVPALLVAEATLSFLGLGFPEPAASWGTMLSAAQNIHMMREAPWMLAPAGALFLVVLSVHLIGGAGATSSALLSPLRRDTALRDQRAV